MKTRIGVISRCVCAIAVAALTLLAFQAESQQYAIDWYTIDGGGGTSTGGVYALSGTIAQPDAGTMTGGNFALTGGFWSIFAAVQTEGAPYLNVTATATNTVVVSWTMPSTSWTLAVARNLNPPVTWTDIPAPYLTNGASLYFVDRTPTGSRFYRLHKP